MTYMFARIRNTLTYGQIQALELFTSIFAVCWGVFLGTPSFDVFKSNTGYALMSVAPEFAWGFACATLGVLTAWGMESGNHRMRRIAARGMTAYWSFVGAVFIVTDWRFMTTVIYPSLAAASLWISWRLGPTRHITTGEHAGTV